MFSSRFFNTDPFSHHSASSIFDTDPFFGRQQQSTQSRLQHRDEYDEKYNPTTSTSTNTNTNTNDKSTVPTTGTTTQRQQQQQSPQQQQQQQLRRRVPMDEDQWMSSSPWSMNNISPFDRYFDRQFNRMNTMMRQLDDRMFDIEENQPTSTSVGGGGGGGLQSPSSSVYSVSSSSYHHTGADGKPIDSHSTRSERHRVGDLIEENYHTRDHLGNERSKLKRGIAGQMKEVIRDRNSQGEERKLENLKGINHDQVEQFDQRWQQEKKKLEEEQHIRWNQPTLGVGQQQQQQQRLNAGSGNNTSTNNQSPVTSSKVESDKNKKVDHDEKKTADSTHGGKSNVDMKNNSTTTGSTVGGTDSTSRVNRVG